MRGSQSALFLNAVFKILSYCVLLVLPAGDSIMNRYRPVLPSFSSPSGGKTNVK